MSEAPVVRSYRISKMWFFLWLPLGIVIGATFVVAGPTLLVGVVFDSGALSSAWWGEVAFALFFMCSSVGAVYWIYGALNIPHEILLRYNGVCEFRSLLHRRRVLPAQQIISLEPDEEQIYVRHQGGRLRIYETDDFDDLLARLKELNPSIQLEGHLGDR